MLMCALLVGACLENPAVTCANGQICAPGNACDDAHGGCATSSQIVACSGKAAEAACSYPGTSEGACYEGVCLPTGCGNGVMAPDEACDDGNRMYGDGCSADCRSTEVCGNGVVDKFGAQSEECDDGNTADGDGCHANCTLPVCGDGVKDVQFNEACDTGSANSDAPNAACRTNCQPKRCGDGVHDSDEVCEDGNVVSGDGCSADCKSLETCGNGYLDVAKGEACDPAAAGGSPCRNDCTIPSCGDGITDTTNGEACDDGPNNSDTTADACRLNCQHHFCGDDVVDSDEVCDDKNDVPGDGCFYQCRSNETCGNGLIDFGIGEQCDDADAQSHDGCTGCRVDQPAWLAVGPDLPVNRQAHAMAFDAARGRLVMFGGFNGSTYLADTWEWDGNAWSNVTPTSGNPPPRRDHAMAYDAARARVVLFGGDAGGSLGDMWEWNGSAWAHIALAAAAPSARRGHAMAYDAARRRIVLFGGTSPSGTNLGDTWEWNGSAWANVTPASGNPGARSEHEMTYDAVRGRVVLFGGQGTSGNFGDTWVWNGSAWSNVTPASGNPGARRQHAMTYDAVRARVVIFGGYDDATSGRLSDTWEWNGSAWTNATPAAGNPSARSNPAMTYDTTRKRVVMFGGYDGTIQLSETWESNGNAWTRATPAMGAPAGRYRFAMAYDASRARVVLFGGLRSSGVLGDTWEWDGSSWTNVTPATGNPSARSSPAMTYDPVRRRVVLFGGYDYGISSRMNDTWEWNGSAWTNVTPASGNPPARESHAMAYDVARSRVVMFGGYTSSGLGADTWEWNGSAWTNVSPAAGSPTARSAHAMAYDAVHARVVLFGGWAGTDFADTWEWNGTVWTNATPTSASPPARNEHAMAYDAARGRVVLFGANGFSDTWEWSGTAWTDVTPASANPRTRTGAAMAYDVAHGRMVMFGGYIGNVGEAAETWTFRPHNSFADERCRYGLDGDNDGKIGCQDPDCFGYCSPLCNPTLMTCGVQGPRCGDGTCQPIESSRLCPSDCGAPTPSCGDFLCESPETIVNCPGDCS